MDVTKQSKGDELEIRLDGRLDNYWATQLGSELEEAVRQRKIARHWQEACCNMPSRVRRTILRPL